MSGVSPRNFNQSMDIVEQQQMVGNPLEFQPSGLPDQPMTHMEGYTNLSLIKEEDFNKHGVGHLHAKNASKRVY